MRVAGSFGSFMGLFGGFECIVHGVRGVDDFWNTIASGYGRAARRLRRAPLCALSHHRHLGKKAYARLRALRTARAALRFAHMLTHSASLALSFMVSATLSARHGAKRMVMHGVMGGLFMGVFGESFRQYTALHQLPLRVHKDKTPSFLLLSSFLLFFPFFVVANDSASTLAELVAVAVGG